MKLGLSPTWLLNVDFLLLINNRQSMYNKLLPDAVIKHLIEKEFSLRFQGVEVHNAVEAWPPEQEAESWLTPFYCKHKEKESKLEIG